jgi:hypothetical protein
MLPHFSNVISHNSLDEPIYKSLFEITFDLPPILGATTQEVRYMLENARSINLPLTPDIEIQTQRFKFSTRAYVTLPTDTHVPDLNILFNYNENEKNAVFVWNTLKKWYDLAWNSQTGETHTKREMIGRIIVNCHNKSGQIYRRVEYVNVQIVGIDGNEYSWDETNIIFDGTTRFCADYYIDTYIS